MALLSGGVRQSPEDEFYTNLTLGLVKFLNSIQRITNITLNKQQPSERTQITTWEQRHNVYLADDMRRFYLSTDGFTLHWSYQYSPNDVRRVGYINFPHIRQISLLKDYSDIISMKTSATSQSPATHKRSNEANCDEPHLTSRSKIFELSNIHDMAKVCLVYETLETINPKIYLIEMQTLKWQFLADTFTEYQRMCVVHLGLPYWELCFAETCHLPSWAEQLFLLLAPHLLESSETRRNHRYALSPSEPIVYNQLDPLVFRAKTKSHKQTPKYK